MKLKLREFLVGSAHVRSQATSHAVCMRAEDIYTAMRFELATRRVTSPDSEIFTPFELQVNFTQKMLALPYQKYTFSERKFDEEFKYGFENEVG